MNFSASADNFSMRAIGGGLLYHNKHASLVFVRESFAVKLLTVLLFTSHLKPFPVILKPSTALRKHF